MGSELAPVGRTYQATGGTAASSSHAGDEGSIAMANEVMRMAARFVKATGLGQGPSANMVAQSVSGMTTGQDEYITLLKEQNRIQRENQYFSAISNTSKTEHETRMAAVRNMRA